MELKNIAIVGAGSWGTALAKLLADRGREVRLWCYEKEVAEEVNRSCENHLYLPGFALPAGIRAFTELGPVVADADMVLSVTPGHALRSVWVEGKRHLKDRAVVVSATKGIEIDTGKLMTEVLEELLPASARIACLSGPSFAREVAAGLPTAVVTASADHDLAKLIQHEISGPTFRTYSSDDVTGVELGGALKNIIAIATGAADGLGLGTNAKAALITRGLAEIARLAVARGANPHTLSGLSGMGDLVLTCTGPLSRNRMVGERLAHGEPIQEILSGMRMVAEGVYTARSARKLAADAKVVMPICEVMYRVLYEKLDIREAVSLLMERGLKPERDF